MEEKSGVNKDIDKFISENTKKYEVFSNIYNLTEEIYEDTIQDIQNHSDVLFKDHSSSIFFFYNIIQASKFHFKKLELILDICVHFSKEIKKNDVTDEELICICCNLSNSIGYLFSKNFFSISSIFQISIQKDELFITFLPELTEYDKEYCELREKILFSKEEKIELKEYYEYVKSNPKDHILHRQMSFHPSPLHKSIREDDIQTFQSILSKNNYSINYKIKMSFYERLKFLIDKELSLIKIAAFYGSLKVFKFLWMQDKIEYDDNLLSYAYAGENFDIIHLCESKCAIKSAYLQPIMIHRQDLLDYFIDNFGNEIIEEDEEIKDKLDKDYEKDDNIYEILNYDSFLAALFSLNFEIIKNCLRKIAFIVRNIENNDSKTYKRNTSLLSSSFFDYDLFKFLFSQRNSEVDKLKCGSYFLAMLNSTLSNGNDAFKLMFYELKENKNCVLMVFKNGFHFNYDIVNFILDFQLKENHEDENSLYSYFKQKIDINVLIFALHYYNEDIIVKLIQLYDVINNTRDKMIFAMNIHIFISKKMTFSLIDRLLLILPNKDLEDIADTFKNQNDLEISQYIMNKLQNK